MDLSVLADFAAEVGEAGPVAAVGGRTAWDVGGEPAPGTRLVRPPAGVVEHQPAEMIVRVRAGTPVAELDELLGSKDQMVPLDPASPARATVGGVLAVGRSGPRRLRWGPVRDLVLEIRFVTAEGRLARTGAAVVKNVSGFDICRLLVGSLGTLGLIGEVVLRTYPRPASSRWMRGRAEPSAALALLYRPASVLWDGATTWVLLEGHPDDVDAEARALGPAFEEVERPPELPGDRRVSLPPGELEAMARSLPAGSFVAEVGVGLVHLNRAADASFGGRAQDPAVARRTATLRLAVKRAMDPDGRLNPGRDAVLAAPEGALAP